MKKLLKENYLRSVFFCLLTLSSCSDLFDPRINFMEYAHIHEDGSGKLELALDLNGIRTFINIAGEFSEGVTTFPTTTIKDTFVNFREKVAKLKGVDSITMAHDQKMLYFKLSFNFNSISTLNNAMNKIYEGINPPNFVYFKMDEQTFERIDSRSVLGVLEHYKKEDDSFVAGFDLNLFFKNMTYTTIYSFDIPIKKATNPLTELSEDQKTSFVQHRILEEEERDVSINNKLFF
ncbi:MAG: hypothetical protein MI674_02995 [Cytophagales bacterium]|nr:hypothetical protein [Cytophagales bacterium]